MFRRSSVVVNKAITTATRQLVVKCALRRTRDAVALLLLSREISRYRCVMQIEAHAPGAQFELALNYDAKRFRRDSSEGGVELVEEDTSEELDQPVVIVEDCMVDVGAGADGGPQLFRRRICWKVSPLSSEHDCPVEATFISPGPPIGSQQG